MKREKRERKRKRKEKKRCKFLKKLWDSASRYATLPVFFMVFSWFAMSDINSYASRAFHNL